MVVSEDFRCRTDDHPADTTGLLADGDGVDSFHELRIADNAVLIRFKSAPRARSAPRCQPTEAHRPLRDALSQIKPTQATDKRCIPSAAVMASRCWKESEVGLPGTIRVDQGTEFVSRDLDLWVYQRGVTLDFSRPGKPIDNAFIEAFNGRFRAEVSKRISC